MRASPRRHRRETAKAAAPNAGKQSISVTLSHAIDELRSQRLPEALDLLRSLRAADLDRAQCALLGLIYLSVEADEEALSWFGHALREGPAPAGALAHRALALQRLGRRQEALASYDEALAAGDLDASGYYHRGNLLREVGLRDEAIASYDAALRLKPAYPEALYAGGTVLFEAGQLDASLEFFDETLRLKPEFCQAWFSRGNALQKLNRHHAALAAYDAALALAPGHPDILTNRGTALYELGRNTEALAAYEEALHSRPDFPQALLNRANVFLRLNKPASALNDCEAALRQRPDYLEALSSKGIALRDLGRVDESIAAFDRALALAPDFAHARNNRGAARLLIGDFEHGLEDYEFRWIGGETPKRELKLPLPEWTGEVRGGEHILVFDEQGFGDAIQFSRYLPLLTKAGARVTFFCRTKLHRLLRTLGPAISLVDTIVKVEDFDCQIALSSLPFVFKTRLETIPAAMPYIFAEAARIAQWTSRLGIEGFKIGLCWHGNQNIRADPARSIPLASFAPLATVAGVRLISLQAGAGVKQLNDLPSSMRVEPPGDDFDVGPDAFLDTAAVMQGLDLIVTCDTSIAHLAGALGRPVWLLLKPIPDWRWLLERSDSPWYPTMRLFRRTDTENWMDLLVRVAAALKEHVENQWN
jgi:tetratricopeptide (TPR) repeat protein